MADGVTQGDTDGGAHQITDIRKQGTASKNVVVIDEPKVDDRGGIGIPTITSEIKSPDDFTDLPKPKKVYSPKACTAIQHPTSDSPIEPSANQVPEVNDSIHKNRVEEVLRSYHDRVAALAPNLFATWNAENPSCPHLDPEEFAAIDPSISSRDARIVQRLSDRLANHPEDAKHLKTIFEAFASNPFSWGVNEKGTSYTLGFLLAPTNIGKLGSYAEMAAKSLKTKGSRGQSRGKAPGGARGTPNDREAADQAFRASFEGGSTTESL